jgi:hypothetical protein
MDIQNVGFLAKTISLSSPTPRDLQNAYRGLSARGSVLITCAPAEIAATLLAAEQAGYFGMLVEGDLITAYKGKEGPCHDTGRIARYCGSAAAVMDDDHHLLSGKLRVCEKTARLYSSEAYEGIIEVSEPDPSLLARLEKDPAPFDCDTFEADAKSLAASLPAVSAAAAGTMVVFYPGPFKLLILGDGSMLPRGRAVRVSAVQARDLELRDGALANLAAPPGTSADPENYSALYRERGAACLLDELPAGAPRTTPRSPDFDALDEAPQTMKHRLRALVSRGDEYFILTGSDPAQKDGCCPSNDVGVANRLVAAGILDAQGAAANSDCPVTLYALAGEIRPGSGKPTFVRNEALRAALRDRIEKGPRLSRKALVRIALLAVMAAAVLTLALALYRQLRSGS